MPRYKTSDGRVITIGEIYGKSSDYYIYSDKIKSLGTDLYPYPKKFKDNKYTYDFNPADCKNFSLVGSGTSRYNIKFGNATNNSREVRYGKSTGGFSIFNDFTYNTGDLTYTGGIMPIYQIFVLASEEVGHYTNAFICYLEPSSYTRTNDYCIVIGNNGDNTGLVAFLNNVQNQLAEPDSSPVADENGFFDSGSDTITLPGIDSINVGSALQSSGVKAHKVDITEINKFFGTLWSTDFFDTIIKNQQAPIDNILSLSTYPYDVHDNGIGDFYSHASREARPKSLAL